MLLRLHLSHNSNPNSLSHSVCPTAHAARSEMHAATACAQSTQTSNSPILLTSERVVSHASQTPRSCGFPVYGPAMIDDDACSL